MSVKYTKEHEWVRLEGDTAVVGITDYAQGQLGDVVFVDLPDVGKKVEQGKEACVVESVKAASEIYAPVSGEVTEVNGVLSKEPQTINADATGKGWIFKLKLKDTKQLDGLMDKASYDAYVKDLH